MSKICRGPQFGLHIDSLECLKKQTNRQTTLQCLTPSPGSLNKNLWAWDLDINQYSLITPGDVQLGLKNSILKQTLAAVSNSVFWDDRGGWDRIEGHGAISNFSKSPRENTHATYNMRGGEGLFVFCLFICVLSIIILAQYCVMKENFIWGIENEEMNYYIRKHIFSRQIIFNHGLHLGKTKKRISCR